MIRLGILCVLLNGLLFGQVTTQVSDTSFTIDSRYRLDENGIDRYLFSIIRENKCIPNLETCDKLEYFVYYYHTDYPQETYDLLHIKTHSKRINAVIRKDLEPGLYIFSVYLSNGDWEDYIFDGFKIE